MLRESLKMISRQIPTRKRKIHTGRETEGRDRNQRHSTAHGRDGKTFPRKNHGTPERQRNRRREGNDGKRRSFLLTNQINTEELAGTKKAEPLHHRG
jgi:hypothetical protein